MKQIEAAGTDFQRTTEYEYDTQGNLITIRRAGDTQTPETITTMTYDDFGNMLTQTDPEGNTTHLTYDIMGNVLTRIDARDNQWQYAYDDAGHLTSMTDPLNQQTVYAYDAKGRKIREESPGGKVMQFEYDLNDNMIQSTVIIDPEDTSQNIVAQYEYNLDKKLIRLIDPEGSVIQYEYDSEGRLVRTIDGNGNEIEQFYDDTTWEGCQSCGGSADSQVTRIDYPTYSREFKYDGRGRKYAERDLPGDGTEHLTRYTYDGVSNLTSKTDAEDQVTEYEYDLHNRLTRVIDTEQEWTSYEYDKRDNLIAVTDAENHTTRFEYDRNNQLVKEIRPMGQETTYAYDETGNLIEKIDAKNQRTEYLYDIAGKMDRIHYYAAADHATPVKTVTFSYDDAGNLTGYNDGTTSAVYEYDNANRKVTETVQYSGFSLNNTYTYYKNNLKKTFTGPDGITYGYLYDANNQLSGVQIPDVGMFTVNSYQWNRPDQETLPGGGRRSYEYDSLMRVVILLFRIRVRTNS